MCNKDIYSAFAAEMVHYMCKPYVIYCDFENKHILILLILLDPSCAIIRVIVMMTKNTIINKIK